jgi:hypothetical protein
MKGLIIDCKTGVQKLIDDGLPPSFQPIVVDPVVLDIRKAVEAINKTDNLERRILALEANRVL